MQILSTKLTIPPQRSRLVTRPRLIQKLNQGLDYGFILVSAPAGYGKSTLLSSWLSRLSYPASWITLDEDDNDPGRFFACLEAAICLIDHNLIDVSENILDYSTDQQLEAALTRLINLLSARKEPCCLVLDDYHVIQNQAIHQATSFLLEHRPVSFKLVIATRADPPLPLARLRARSCLLELRLADLRFTPQETTEFLSRTMGLKVTEDNVIRLNERTEGWIAGLQIAALSMQDSHDFAGFINSLSGSHHYIFDYLLEEILGRQTQEVQRFLLDTAILDQLTAPLCDALLAGDEVVPPARSSSILLETLEHANLFIVPLDQEQRWYRYHSLFAELLRGYLKKNDPARLPLLHARASMWFEAQGLIADAIRHALAANEWEGVIRLISSNIFALLEQNELNSVARQIEKITGEIGSARPWLLIARAWLAVYTGQLSSVEPILTMAETEIDHLKSEQELQTLGGHIAAIRAYLNWIDNKWDIASNAARVALEWLPENEYQIRCQAATTLGLTLYDLDAGGQAFEQAMAYARKTNISHVTIFALGSWAWLLAMQAKLHRAHSTIHDAIDLVQSNTSLQSLPSISYVYTTLSFLLYEWNDLEGSLRYSREAVNLARRWEQVDALHFALTYLGYALFASGKTAEAFEIVHQAWQVACRTSLWFKQITISQEIELNLAQDNVDSALKCAQQAAKDLTDPGKLTLNTFKSGYLTLMIVRIYIAQKQYDNALTLIERLLHDLEKRKLWNYYLRTLTWQAVAYQGLRENTHALASLKRALAMAAPEGYVRTFIHGDEELISLLKQARKNEIYPKYIDKLLSAVSQEEKRTSDRIDITSLLVEPLSDREMDVLKLLAQGCSDKKIAEGLVIARETVHKHLKNIYGKLDVHSRTEAVARARELSLL